MRHSFLLFALLIGMQIGNAQKTDLNLQKKVVELINVFDGDIGIYIKSFKTGKVVAIQANTFLPTASMIKLPILAGIMERIRTGELNYHQPIIYKDSLLYPGEDILG